MTCKHQWKDEIADIEITEIKSRNDFAPAILKHIRTCMICGEVYKSKIRISKRVHDETLAMVCGDCTGRTKITISPAVKSMVVGCEHCKTEFEVIAE